MIFAFYSPTHGAGKSTAAGMLADKINVRRVSFAWPLAQIARYYFYSSDKPIDFNKDAVLDNGKTLRELMIKLGQAGREFDPDIWIKILFDRCYCVCRNRTGHNVIIDDLRFPNEYAALERWRPHVKFIKIIRPELKLIKSDTEALLENYAFDYIISSGR